MWNDTAITAEGICGLTSKGKPFCQGEAGMLQPDLTESPRDGGSAWLSAPAASTATGEALPVGHTVFVLRENCRAVKNASGIL